MLGRINKKLEAKKRTLLRYVCETGSWSSGVARRMINDGDITVNGRIERDTERIIEPKDMVDGY